ncbi:alpha-amylase family protein [Lentzea californiensis]|uniref:alpha-amylase family protein n=1 Tax=Lentzea californiensis TaxID=438851 RepID=UPI0021661210|nr:alpha-amylase family protein [Lentzea californiensis]MCR3750452.1 maltose alpha-D-glucosyltransferase/ alpha-amylase [Lentzea californiensis]
MVERWYRNGVIYSLDVCLFQDSDGDGVGDLRGLMSRLDYLSRLGVDTVWLNPFHPSPRRDGGYDVTDHYAVDPKLGSLGDFAELLDHADERGVRVMMDLVVNHTSDEHPWFRAARAARDSPFRHWYVWSDDEPADRWEGSVFPGVETETWTYDEQAEAWYQHRFYRFQPNLNTDHPAVRAEIRKIVSFWARLGVSGFRVDAAPFLISSPSGQDFSLLRDIRETASWQRRDAVVLAEANVEDHEVLEYFGHSDNRASRALMLFSFRLNQAVMLALARGDAGSIATVLQELPDLPRNAQWATFLRNHDEVDLGRLPQDERDDVFAAFGPDPDMRLYGRGIRRRLVSMLDGDRRRVELAYSLQLTLPGTPVLRYGDEIGMGEDLTLPEREAIRTPMQWSDAKNAGFSRADSVIRPVISTGPRGCAEVNVARQRSDPHSLLTWFERILHTRRECEEIATGEHEVLDVGPPHLLVHVARRPRGVMLFVHNLSPEPCQVSVPPQTAEEEPPQNVVADGAYDNDVDLLSLQVNGYGFRWIRLADIPWS